MSVFYLMGTAAWAQVTSAGVSSISQKLSGSVINSAGIRQNTVLTPNAVGIVAAVKGEVQVAGEDGKTRTVKSGMPLFVGDRVKTGEKSHSQVLFLDETVFTLGEKSELVIDDFIYDPEQNTGRVFAEIVEGVFRFVTGKIAKKEPENMKVKLPSGTIGIRGTIVGGRVQGGKSFVMLLGPGKNNNTGDRLGQISLENVIDGKKSEVLITKTGFGSSIDDFDVPPAPPMQVPRDVVMQLANDLMPDKLPFMPRPGLLPARAPTTASEEAGQIIYDEMDVMFDSEQVRDLLILFDEEQLDSAIDASDGTNAVMDGLATLEDLRKLDMGIGCFFQPGVPFNGGGSYDFYYEINFGMRRVGGGNSRVEGTASNVDPDPFRFNLGPRFFAQGVGPAIFDYQNIPDSHAVAACQNCQGDVHIALNNQGGVIAEFAHHRVNITNGTVSDVGNGDAFRSCGGAC